MAKFIVNVVDTTGKESVLKFDAETKEEVIAYLQQKMISFTSISAEQSKKNTRELAQKCIHCGEVTTSTAKYCQACGRLVTTLNSPLESDTPPHLSARKPKKVIVKKIYIGVGPQRIISNSTPQKHSSHVYRPKPEMSIFFPLLSFFCFDFFTGILAILFYCKIDARWRQKDYVGAESAKRTAVLWCWISLITGIVFWGCYFYWFYQMRTENIWKEYTQTTIATPSLDAQLASSIDALDAQLKAVSEEKEVLNAVTKSDEDEADSFDELSDEDRLLICSNERTQGCQPYSLAGGSYYYVIKNSLPFEFVYEGSIKVKEESGCFFALGNNSSNFQLWLGETPDKLEVRVEWDRLVARFTIDELTTTYNKFRIVCNRDTTRLYVNDRLLKEFAPNLVPLPLVSLQYGGCGPMGDWAEGRKGRGRCEVGWWSLKHIKAP